MRFEGEGMGRSELPAVETNTGVGLGCPKYLKKQPSSTGGGSTTEQQAEPGNKAFTSSGSQAVNSGALSSSGYGASAHDFAAWCLAV